jgi:saccharopine dehydrogenase (NAD+, L-lysine-forming)
LRLQIEQINYTPTESGADMIDILVRGDVVDRLEKYRKKMVDQKRIFITQAGFHPGLPAPFIRYAKHHFEEYQTANVVMAMNVIFEKPASTYEIIYEIGEAKATILSNGVWKKATYKDALQIQFSDRFGIR